MDVLHAVLLLGGAALIFRAGMVCEAERRRFTRRLRAPSDLCERIATRARGVVTR